MRRFGVTLAPSPKYQRILEKRPHPPGQHGVRARRTKVGAYGSRLTEKQKLRFHYSMQEKQFRRFLDIAKKSKGNTANTMVQILESRLDNVLRRLGAQTAHPDLDVRVLPQFVLAGHATVERDL